MTGFEITILIVCVVVIAGAVGAYLTKGQPSMEEFLEEPKKENFQPRKVTVVEKETEAVAQELYNKDLRPVVAKKATKEEKASLLESAQELVKEIEKVAKVPTTQEESQQLAKDLVEIATGKKKSKSEFPIDGPKKKRKYYPKKKKA